MPSTKAERVRDVLNGLLSSEDKRTPKGDRWSPGKIAAQIMADREAIYGDDWESVHIERDTVLRALEKRTGKDGKVVRPSKQSIDYIYVWLVHIKQIEDKEIKIKPAIRDPFFEVLCKTFEVNSGIIDTAYKDFSGAFEFYAHSEEYPGKYVRGAIRFLTKEGRPSTLLIEERQEAKDDINAEKRFEKWLGYFFEIGDICVIVAHRPTRKIPKFYVLHTSRWEEGSSRVTDMDGRLLKVGSGKPFSSRVLMHRNPDAFERCSIIPPSDLPPGVRRRLGPPDDEVPPV